MLYLWLKYIHIISSTILFGTGIGTASIMLYAHFSKNIITIAAVSRYVVIADWIFTATSGIMQPITGIAMVVLAGYSFKTLWVAGSIIGYIISGACWLPVVYLQLKMRDVAAEALAKNSKLPLIYYRYFKIWFILGWPAFLSLMVVFYLMTFKPV